MKERVVQFGYDGKMLGIVTEPDAERQRVKSPAVLLLTAGVLHRVGPFRAYVDLARQLAALGFTSLRFDMSGLGDSEIRTSTLDREERATTDIREAMELLRARWSVDRFVVAGLCTGAYYGHRAAVSEPSVCGAVMLDGYAYRTWGFYRRYWRSRLCAPQRWRTMLERRLKQLCGRLDSIYQPGELEEAEFFDCYPPRDQVSRELHGLAERGVPLLLVFTGGTGLFNAREQFVEMYGEFAATSDLTVEYHGQADHTFSRVADRRRMIDVVTRWMDAHYPVMQEPAQELGSPILRR